MKLNIKDIKNKNQWQNIILPEYNAAAVAQNTKSMPRWAHFGSGNIFRIFIGGIVHRLITLDEMNSGIVCIEGFDYEIINKIYKPYDNLVLAVTLNSDGTKYNEIYGSLGEAITTKDKVRLEEIFTDSSLQLVSFTITEKGYILKDSYNNYLPHIQKDIALGEDSCRSVIPIVCSMLYKRYKCCKAPLALVSLDNCSKNGDKLKEAILTIAKEWYSDNDFMEYLNNSISYPWTMIDKITPRPSETVAEELKSLGVEDMDIIVTDKNTYIAPFVNAERPEYLVIEDSFPNGRPSLEKAGVYMTDRETVNKAEKMKVTACLNPLHTALAVFGCVLGYNKISDEMKNKSLKALVEGIGKEGMAVVIDPVIISPKEFIDEVINERLTNPFIPDSPQRIATDTSQKVAIRYGETIKAYKNAESLVYIPLAIAGWCRYLLGIDDNGSSFKLSSDPRSEELREHLKCIEIGNSESYTGQLNKILSDESIFGLDLYTVGLGNKIENMFKEMIASKGAVLNTINKYI